MSQQQQANEEAILDDQDAAFDENYYDEINTWWLNNAYEISFPQIVMNENSDNPKPLITRPGQCIFASEFDKKKNSQLYQNFLDELRGFTFPIVRITLGGHEGDFGRVQKTSISEEIIQDICKNLPQTCVAVVFENITCRQYPEYKYKIPTEIIYSGNDSKIAGWVNLDEAVSKAVQNSNVNWLILGQVNKGHFNRYDVEHLGLWCRKQKAEKFEQKTKINVEETLLERKKKAQTQKKQGYTVKEPDQSEINKEQYQEWLGHLMPKKPDKDTTDKYKEYDDDITEQQFKDLSLSQQQYENIITKVIEGNFTTADESLNGRECNIFDLIHALENYKKNDNSRPEICRQGCLAKAFSFGEKNAKLRRINQLAKILEGVYTKNMNLEEKRKAKQNWKTNNPDKHDQLITWLDLEYISQNTKAITIHNNH